MGSGYIEAYQNPSHVGDHNLRWITKKVYSCSSQINAECTMPLQTYPVDNVSIHEGPFYQREAQLLL